MDNESFSKEALRLILNALEVLDPDNEEANKLKEMTINKILLML